ncbi:hypothetical protein GCM10022199_01690 [Marihabitans asiaticum]|uniref:non-specific serine/threonine protein kinase n=1 Tax=Marihabitans asiaticum TaxID=415218 RepID=A0A560WGE1_9MICO|nr:serine/threonine-protein kinase [Marihabitans asiaticum]TWD16555.1 serine/threonine protein kinase [Marihabitans asiaticum]
MSVGVPPELPGLTYIQPLGSGGYADVFLYQQEMPRMPVAVKVLKGDGLTDALRRQFIEEANTMAQLADHPFIVQIFRAGTSEDGRPYLVMKYYPPPNLAARARAERLSCDSVLTTGIQLASAVETAHRAGIIHRDIKPANVLVSSYGAPGLTDFGIAGRGAALEEDLDEIGVSVPWAPPEVLFGQSNGDVRADVYSLAATLWQLLVGRSPFEVPGGDNSAYDLMPRIRDSAVPATGRADVPASLERLLTQTMSKRPEARPASAIEFARALQAIEQEQRLPRTQIVVLDEQGHTTVADRRSTPDRDDRTRIKAPQAVRGAQALDPATARRSAARWGPQGAGPADPAAPSDPSDSVTDRRPAVPAVSAAETTAGGVEQSDPADAGTVQVHRERVRAEGSSAATGPARAESTIRIGPGTLVGALLALVLLGGAAAVALTRSGEQAEPQQSSTSTIKQESSGPIVAVPEPPSLAAAPGEGGVVLTWTSDDLQRTDRFTVRAAQGEDGDVEAADAVSVQDARRHLVKAKAGTKVCAQVRVDRAGVSSTWSEVQCDVAT